MEPWMWFVLGLVLIVAEIFTLSFASLWFGFAAVVVSVIVWLFPMAMPTWQSQAVLWLIVSSVSVVAWFKLVEPAWKRQQTQTGLGGGVIIGEIGMIVRQPLADQPGTVRFRVPKVGATEWQCRSYQDKIEVGDRVMVTNILGNELIVRPLNVVRKEDEEKLSNSDGN